VCLRYEAQNIESLPSTLTRPNKKNKTPYTCLQDLDVHQGNGTAAIFEADPRVTTFDVFGGWVGVRWMCVEGPAV
jgi:hypothetical protein